MDQVRDQNMLLRILSMLVVTTVVLMAQAHAGQYSVTTINNPDATWSLYGTTPLGINDYGQVVGVFAGPPTADNFLYYGGHFTTLTYPTGWGSAVAGINNAGVIVGHTGDGFGFWDQNDAVTKVMFGDWLQFTGVNNLNQAIGNYNNGSGIHGLIYAHSTGVITKLDAPDAIQTELLGINDSGQIIGIYESTTGWYNFLYSGGSFTVFSMPGAVEINVTGINNLGQIVGDYWTGSGPTEGFLYSNGAFATLDVPGSTGTIPLGINNLGQIVGSYANVVNGNEVNGFIMTPLPEPGTLSLAGAAILLVGLVHIAAYRVKLRAVLNGEGQLP
jgi:probable HAF family extracellular repeat protein